jgi:hypothetical protein
MMITLNKLPLWLHPVCLIHAHREDRFDSFSGVILVYMLLKDLLEVLRDRIFLLLWFLH